MERVGGGESPRALFAMGSGIPRGHTCRPCRPRGGGRAARDLERSVELELGSAHVREETLPGPEEGSFGVSARYLVRFDDLCPTMNWDVWKSVEEVLFRTGIRPLLAVIPDNQ